MTLTDYRYVATEPIRAGLRDLAAAGAKVPTDSVEGRELAEVIKDTEAALHSIFTNAVKREEERERAKKWKAILPKCRAALDRVKEFSLQLEAAVQATTIGRNSVVIAENRLSAALGNEPRPESYPTPGELAEYAAIVRDLEAAVKAASAHCRELVDAEGRIGLALREAHKELAQLVFQERHLRPRTATEPAWSIASGGQLSAVP